MPECSVLGSSPVTSCTWDPSLRAGSFCLTLGFSTFLTLELFSSCPLSKGKSVLSNSACDIKLRPACLLFPGTWEPPSLSSWLCAWQKLGCLMGIQIVSLKTLKTQALFFAGKGSACKKHYFVKKPNINAHKELQFESCHYLFKNILKKDTEYLS